MYGKHNDQNKQRAHHDLADPFQTILQTSAAYQKAQDNDYSHPDAHFTRVLQHIEKFGAAAFGIHPLMEGACGKFEKVGNHPSSYGGVVHHQHITAKDGNISVDMPETALFFKGLVA